MKPPPVEEHHRHVDASIPGIDDALAQSIEVGQVELREIELWFAVGGAAATRPRPRLWRHTEMEIPAGCLRLELLPTPEPNEVVPVLVEEIEVRGVVVHFRRLAALTAWTQAILKIVPDVRAGEIDGTSLVPGR